MTRPVQMAFAPDGRLFITQQDGKLRVFKNGQLLATPFVTVTTHNSGERGLLGIAFDPNFASNKFVYVYYTHPNGSGGYVNRVSRFTANGDVAVARQRAGPDRDRPARRRHLAQRRRAGVRRGRQAVHRRRRKPAEHRRPEC